MTSLLLPQRCPMNFHMQLIRCLYNDSRRHVASMLFWFAPRAACWLRRIFRTAMSQHRSRPSNASGIYYDGLVRAAAPIIDERPWLQTIDVEDQRSIFVAVCMAIYRYSISDVPFFTFRFRLLHAYAQSGLVMLFTSRTS